MVDITTIEPNYIPMSTMDLIDANRSLQDKNRQLNYVASTLLFIVIVTAVYIQTNKPKNENCSN